jgi:hypothetical protein
MVSPERVVAERESEMGMRVGRVYTMLMFCCSSPVCFCVIEKESVIVVCPIEFHAHPIIIHKSSYYWIHLSIIG